MLNICSHCGSADTMAGLDKYQCLHCGQHTNSDGSMVAPTPVKHVASWFGRRNIDGGQYDRENG